MPMEARLDLEPGGLLLELGDLIVLVCHHQAKAGSFLPIDLHDSHGELRALFLVEAQEVGVVLLADLVNRTG